MLTEKERRSADLVELSNLREFVQRILVPEQNQLVYVLADGRELKVPWQNPSRSLSWTPEMREEARQRKLEQEKSKREE